LSGIRANPTVIEGNKSLGQHESDQSRSKLSKGKIGGHHLVANIPSKSKGFLCLMKHHQVLEDTKGGFTKKAKRGSAVHRHPAGAKRSGPLGGGRFKKGDRGTKKFGGQRTRDSTFAGGRWQPLWGPRFRIQGLPLAYCKISSFQCTQCGRENPKTERAF